MSAVFPMMLSSRDNFDWLVDDMIIFESKVKCR